MTRAQWDAAMARYMHRSDLTADLALTFAFARDAVEAAWFGRVPWSSEAELLATVPRGMTHSGLAYLHELAQDDAGMQRELGMAAEAIAAAQMRASLDANPLRAMTRPYQDAPNITGADDAG
jgi:hypothetical protein